MNVTEVRDSDFKNAFLRIFNFTVGILLTGFYGVIFLFSCNNEIVDAEEIVKPLPDSEIGVNKFRRLWKTSSKINVK